MYKKANSNLAGDSRDDKDKAKNSFVFKSLESEVIITTEFCRLLTNRELAIAISKLISYQIKLPQRILICNIF